MRAQRLTLPSFRHNVSPGRSGARGSCRHALRRQRAATWLLMLCDGPRGSLPVIRGMGGTSSPSESFAKPRQRFTTSWPYKQYNDSNEHVFSTTPTLVTALIPHAYFIAFGS